MAQWTGPARHRTRRRLAGSQTRAQLHRVERHEIHGCIVLVPRDWGSMRARRRYRRSTRLSSRVLWCCRCSQAFKTMPWPAACHLPPFPLPPHRTASSASCSISPSKSVPSDSLKSALDRVPLHSPRRLPLSLLFVAYFFLHTLHLSSRDNPRHARPQRHSLAPCDFFFHLFCEQTGQHIFLPPNPNRSKKKRVILLTAFPATLRFTNSPASTAAPRVQSSPAQPSRAQPKPSLSLGTPLALSARSLAPVIRLVGEVT